MNPRMNMGICSYPLPEPTIVPSVLRTRNRLHDGSPGDVDSGVPISVIGVATGLTDKGGLTLAVGLFAVSTATTRSTGVTRVYRRQPDPCQSSLILKKETELPE